MPTSKGIRLIPLSLASVLVLQACERDETFGDQTIIQDPQEVEEVRDEAIREPRETRDPVDVAPAPDPAIEDNPEQPPLR